MNAVDLIIIGAVGLLALLGHKSGLLKPVSGIGGLVLGIFLAMHHSAQAAPLLVDYIDGETLRRVAAFASIVLAATIACRVAAILIKWLLNTLVHGWVDHVAGAAGGAALGIILSGTTVYVLSGTNLGSTSHALEVSRLAPEISRASLISADMPWCSSIQGSPADQSCTDLKSLFKADKPSHS